ncbi:MAG: hypothetical protein CMH54_01305 [Myxococcales bacterium]|nr:hypothetical protein [Myxococcales bacterium]
MTRFLKAFPIALIPFLFVACGGGGGGGANAIDLPGDDSRLVSDLTPEEATALCAQAIEAGQSIMGNGGFMCVAQGLGMEQAGFGDCEEMAAECLAESENNSASISEECAGAFDDLVDCTATVAELEDCLNEQNGILADAIGPYSDISCDSDPAILQELESMGEPEEPACMGEIEAKCPGLTKDDDAPPNDGPPSLPEPPE